MRIRTIDLNFSGVSQTIASFLVEDGNHLALIETGPSSTRAQCVRQLAEWGIAPSDIKHVLVTHIHFDHAGAAGWWAAQGARIYVHPAGAPHIIDPERLVSSARQVYGDSMDEMWGEVAPVPSEQVTVVNDNDVISVGNLHFTAWDTPGHARHHHVYVIDGIAFCGDVAGCRLPWSNFISLTGAPPQFELPTYDSSISRLLDARLDKLYLTHFGSVDGVEDHLARYREIVWGSAELIHAHVRNGAERPELVREFEAYNRSRARRDHLADDVWRQYDTANPFAMSADGVALYWRRKHRSAS